MCRNHSHLIARFLGEDTTGEVAVLMFALAQEDLVIESPGQTGMKWTLRTSGMLYLPSLVAVGWDQWQEPPTAVQRTSLFLLPAEGMTTTQQLLENVPTLRGLSQTAAADSLYRPPWWSGSEPGS